MSFREPPPGFGTAKTSDQDFVAKTGALTFNPAETTTTIPMDVKGDSRKEADEAFDLDIRELLFGCPKQSSLERRASAAVGRLLKRLHVRHLVAKIPRTRRWRITQRGRHLLSLTLQLYKTSWPELAV